MDNLSFSFEDSMITDSDMKETELVLKKEIERMKLASQSGYNDDRGSINLPFDMEAKKNVATLVKQKLELKPKYLIVVGIGGSNQGTMAVQEAVYGKLFNLLAPQTKILYAETVDSDDIKKMLFMVKMSLEKGENVILNVVSKSGVTTETIALFELFLDLLRRYKNDHGDLVVVTTEMGSKLWDLARKRKYSMLKIPKNVTGRFSVLSPVGLFPLGLMGIDIDALLEGARFMREMCLKEYIKDNPAALSAAYIYIHNKKGKNIHDLFLFAKDLEVMGKWYRQLMGESIGKEYDRNGNQVFAGITPTISIGSTDLHSVAQLYLGGPYDKSTTFVTVRNMNNKVGVPSISEFSDLVPNIQGRDLKVIMDAIEKGVKAAYRKRKRPFIEIVLPDKKEASIGQFLQFKMMEMMYLGALLNVNPFNQPNVKSYKSETKRILARPDSEIDS